MNECGFVILCAGSFLIECKCVCVNECGRGNICARYLKLFECLDVNESGFVNLCDG